MVVIFGSSGFVGSYFLKTTSIPRNSIKTPTSREVDITKPSVINTYISLTKPTTIVNFSARAIPDEVEKERGNKEGDAWKINVTGAFNIAQAANQHNAYLIHISTGDVFPGNTPNPGPYREDALRGTLTELSWYGFTKAMAEGEIGNCHKHSAIVRISHPFGNPHSPRDLVNKTISHIKNKKPLWNNQFFTPTYLHDLTLVLDRLVENPRAGIFHVVTKPRTTRYEFGQYINGLYHLSTSLIAHEILPQNGQDTFVYQPRTGGLRTEKTEATLGISFSNWQEAIKILNYQV